MVLRSMIRSLRSLSWHFPLIALHSTNQWTLGIICAWKLRYRSLLIRSIVEDLESGEQRCDDSQTLTQDMQGLTEGHDPHMLDVARMVKKSWTEVTELTICKCGIKSDVWPRATSDELTATYGWMTNTLVCTWSGKTILKTNSIWSELRDL